jgi:hypothetical protein
MIYPRTCQNFLCFIFTPFDTVLLCPAIIIIWKFHGRCDTSKTFTAITFSLTTTTTLDVTLWANHLIYMHEVFISWTVPSRSLNLHLASCKATPLSSVGNPPVRLVRWSAPGPLVRTRPDQDQQFFFLRTRPDQQVFAGPLQ